LFVRTLQNLRDQPVGFDTKNLVTLSVDPQESGYGEDKTPHVMRSVLDGMGRVYGVTSVAGTTDPELDGDRSFDGFVIQGHKAVEGESTDFETGWVTPGYFATLRMPLLVGRDFNEADKAGGPKVAIVNQSFVKKFYGSAASALGRLIGDGDTPDRTIVGVVGDVRHENLRTEIGPGVYMPYFQMEHPAGLEVYARTAHAPEPIEAGIRRAVYEVDPTLVVDDMRSMEQKVDISASNERALAMLAAVFAVLASMLAAVGLYGVLAYSTQSRTREIGVRLALGAPRRTLVVLVVREMAWIAGIAAIFALPATVALARLFSSQLYGVSTWDPVTLIGALLLTAAMVALASAVPAQRATAVGPMEALRTE
jgi:predicted permease